MVPFKKLFGALSECCLSRIPKSDRSLHSCLCLLMAKKQPPRSHNDRDEPDDEDDNDDGLGDRPFNTSKGKAKPFGFDGRDRKKKKKGPKGNINPDRGKESLYDEKNLPKALRLKKQDWFHIPEMNFPTEKPNDAMTTLILAGFFLLLVFGSVPLGALVHWAWFILSCCSMFFAVAVGYLAWLKFFTPWPVFQVSRNGVKYVNKKGNHGMVKWENYENVAIEFPINTFTNEPEDPVLVIIARTSDNQLRRHTVNFSYFDGDVFYLRELVIAARLFVLFGIVITRPLTEEAGIEDDLYSMRPTEDEDD